MKKILSDLDIYLACTALVGLTLLAIANVFSRYVFNFSIAFTDELTTNLCVLASLMGGAVAAKKKRHIGLTMLTDRMSSKAQRIVSVAGNILSGSFSLLVVYLGMQMMMQQMNRGQISPALRIPMWIYDSFLPIGMAFVCVSFFIVAYNEFRQAPKEDS